MMEETEDTTEDAAARKAAEGLYDLFLMGLTWLREDRPQTLTRRGSSVFAAYHSANPLFKAVKDLAPQCWELLELVRENGIIHRGEKPPGVKALRKLIAESEKHLVILVTPPDELNPEKAFGPEGFSYVITDAGMALAHSRMQEERYSQIITAESYRLGWAKFRARMTAYNTKKASASGSSPDEVVVLDGEEALSIPKAPRSEEDFDW